MTGEFPSVFCWYMLAKIILTDSAKLDILMFIAVGRVIGEYLPPLFASYSVQLTPRKNLKRVSRELSKVKVYVCDIRSGYRL